MTTARAVGPFVPQLQPLDPTTPGSNRVFTALPDDGAGAEEVDPRVEPEGEKRGGEGGGKRRNLGLAALGWMVVALALAFLGHELWRNDPWALAGARASELALAVAVGTLAYGLAGFLLAEAWRRLLGTGPAEVDPWRHRVVYGRTQIAKYLPGNVFHLVGRQVLGRRLGHAQGALALASLGETVLLLLVAGILGLPASWPYLERTLGWPGIAIALAAAGAIAVVAGLSRGLMRDWRVPFCGRGPIGIRARQALRASLLYAAFFVVAGLILWGITAAVGGAEGALGPVAAVAIMAMAWWVGFVTPGSSAGVGVREVVLVLALEPSLGSEGAMLTALTLRLITTCGDLLFFAVCAVTHRGPPADQEAGQANRAPMPPILK